MSPFLGSLITIEIDTFWCARENTLHFPFPVIFVFCLALAQCTTVSWSPRDGLSPVILNKLVIMRHSMLLESGDIASFQQKGIMF